MAFEKYPWLPYVLLLAFALLSVWAYGFWQLPIYGDRAYFTYLYQLVARGGSLYQDSPYGYTPLGPLLGGGLIYLLQDLTGLKSYLIPRLGGFVVFFLSSVGFYRLGLRLFGRKPIALIAGLSWLGLSFIAVISGGGLEPKALVALFVIFALLALYSERYFLSGLLCGLAVCTWQVAGIYVIGVLIWLFLHRPIAWKAVRHYILGGAVTLAALLLYLYLADAGTAFWQQAFLRKLAVEGESLGESPLHWITKLKPGFVSDLPFFIGAFAGFVVFGYRLLKQKVTDSTLRSRLLLLTICTLLWSGFNSIEFQGTMDYVPMLPLLVLWLSYLVHLLLKNPGHWYPSFAVVLVLFFADLLFIPKSLTLQEQENIVRDIKAQHPTTRVVVSGADFWYVLNEESAPTKYFRMQYFEEHLMDRFTQGGKEQVLQDLHDYRPTLLIVPIKEKRKSMVSEADIFVRFREEVATTPVDSLMIPRHKHLSVIPNRYANFNLLHTQWTQ